jgi:6-phosphogluconolactonase (cycloisomerase 2 family)
MISILDPDTLTIKETRDLGFGIYCLDYNETRDEYVVGISGSQNFQILNSDFTVKSDIYQPTERTAEYIIQGCSCDDNFIYFVLYNENVITVYDWNGDFVTLIELEVNSMEPEHITVIDNEIYIGCATYGAKIFHVTPITGTD